MTTMSDIFITDAQKEREEWLQSLGCTEADVDDDEGGEFVRLDGPTSGIKGGAKVYLPSTIQSENIYN